MSIERVTDPEVPPPDNPVPAVTPVMSPSLLIYPSEVHAVDPLPHLSLLVSVSNPNSPAARVGFAEVHEAADPRRI